MNSDAAELMVARAVEAAWQAARSANWNSASQRAVALRTLAKALADSRHDVMATAAEETQLTHEELAPEFARAIGTLRMFATILEEGSWVRAAVDTSQKTGELVIGPNHDVRRMLRPLGGVAAVFGASNFPLAYGVLGGDTASALAAGCGVVVKEHPSHPKTGTLIASLGLDALRQAGIDSSVLQYVHDDESDDFLVGRRIVEHDCVCAVGFTGSRVGGLAIESVARGRTRPIPVFAEMSSTNAVLVSLESLRRRSQAIAREVAGSLLMRHGQQCTCPGLIVLEGPSSEHGPFREELARCIRTAPQRRMLNQRMADQFHAKTQMWDGPLETRVFARGTVPASGSAADATTPLIIESDSTGILQNPTLLDEIFGPCAVMASLGELFDPRVISECLMGNMGGQLTATLYLEPEHEGEPRYVGLAAVLQRSVGRIVFNGPPTGVRVAAGMVHGGPFPATNRPDTTAVGPLAIERWCRPVCFQNCPDALLPPELQNANPLGILRQVNGQFTRDPICP